MLRSQHEKGEKGMEVAGRRERSPEWNKGAVLGGFQGRRHGLPPLVGRTPGLLIGRRP